MGEPLVNSWRSRTPFAFHLPMSNPKRFRPERLASIALSLTILVAARANAATCPAYGSLDNIVEAIQESWEAANGLRTLNRYRSEELVPAVVADLKLGRAVHSEFDSRRLVSWFSDPAGVMIGEPRHARLLYELAHPLVDVAQIRERQQSVATIVSAPQILDDLKTFLNDLAELAGTDSRNIFLQHARDARVADVFLKAVSETQWRAKSTEKNSSEKTTSPLVDALAISLAPSASINAIGRPSTQAFLDARAKTREDARRLSRMLLQSNLPPMRHIGQILENFADIDAIDPDHVALPPPPAPPKPWWQPAALFRATPPAAPVANSHSARARFQALSATVIAVQELDFLATLAANVLDWDGPSHKQNLLRRDARRSRSSTAEISRGCRREFRSRFASADPASPAGRFSKAPTRAANRIT